MTLTVAQPLIPVFHPDSEVLPLNSAVLNLQKENECVSCKVDFEPNETGIIGHHTEAAGVWHAIHKDCLRHWCLTKVQPSTKMVNCIACSAPLNVRSLFPRNSVRDCIRILTDVAPSIRSSTIGAGAFIWGFVFDSMLDQVQMIPQVQTLLQNQWCRYIYRGTIATKFFLLSNIAARLFFRGMQEGDPVAVLAGLSAGLVKAIGIKNNFPLRQQMGPCLVAPLVAAIVALARALRDYR